MTREVTQARFYIGGNTAALLHDDAVPEIVPGIVEASMRMSPFERHVLNFMNGKRSIGRIFKKSGMEDGEFKASVAMLGDKGIIRVRTTKKKKKKIASSTLLSALDTPVSAEPSSSAQSEQTILVESPPPSALRAPSSARQVESPSLESRQGSVRPGFASLRAEGVLENDLAADARSGWGDGEVSNVSNVFARARASARGVVSPAVEPPKKDARRSPPAPDGSPAALLEGASPSAEDDDGSSFRRQATDLRLRELKEFEPSAAMRAAALDDGDGEDEEATGLGSLSPPSSLRAEDDGFSADGGTFADPPPTVADPVENRRRIEPSASADEREDDALRLPMRIGGGIHDELTDNGLASRRAVLSDDPTGPLPALSEDVDEIEAQQEQDDPHAPRVAAQEQDEEDEQGDNHAQDDYAQDDDEQGDNEQDADEQDDDEQDADERRSSPEHDDAAEPEDEKGDGQVEDDGRDFEKAAAVPGSFTAPVVSPPLVAASPAALPPALLADRPAPLPLPGQALVARQASAPEPAKSGPPLSPAVGSGGAPRTSGAPAGGLPSPRPSASSKVPFDQARKAEKIFEQAVKDHAEGRPSSARMNAKLAAMYDPTVETYKSFLAELEANGEGAKSPGVSKPRDLALFEQASEAEGKGEYERAVKFLEEAISISPKAAALRNRLGVVLSIRLKRHKEALDHLRMAIDLEPGNIVYMNNFSKVTALFDSALEKDPNRGRRATKDDGHVAIKKIRPKMF